MARVLIVDDEDLICKLLAGMVTHLGHEAYVAHSIGECLDCLKVNPPDVVLLDVKLPDGSGLDIIETIKTAPTLPDVIIMTAYGDPKGAEIAIRSGAWDYIAKPFAVKDIAVPVLRAIQYRDQLREIQEINIDREGIVGTNPKLQACLDMVRQAAGSDVNVLITGETGTGKELFARSIHNNSRRSQSDFVVVDCTALPENLVESILFGHSKGAFTGADRTRDGLIRQAHHGTLFLDEMGELPMSLQKTFLRVLQEHRFRPLGSHTEVESDFRLISATNKNLDEMVANGHFREDLLYRLGAMTIRLPALREITEDIGEIALFYVKRICLRFGVQIKGCSDEFLKALMRYNWPGNIRELYHVLERSCAAALRENTLFPIHLPEELRVHVAKSQFTDVEDSRMQSREKTPLPTNGKFPNFKRFRKMTLSEAEEKYLRDLLETSSGSIREACNVAGLSRTRLYGLLKKYRIKPSHLGS